MANSGGKHNLVVLTGIEVRGWQTFSNLLKDFISERDNRPMAIEEKEGNDKIDKRKSFVDVVRSSKGKKVDVGNSKHTSSNMY